MSKIKGETVKRAIEQQVPGIVGHMNLEGIAYIKITRTGANECFASDETSQVLIDKGMGYDEQAEVFWKKPAADKYA